MGRLFGKYLILEQVFGLLKYMPIVLVPALIQSTLYNRPQAKREIRGKRDLRQKEKRHIRLLSSILPPPEGSSASVWTARPGWPRSASPARRNGGYPLWAL